MYKIDLSVILPITEMKPHDDFNILFEKYYDCIESTGRNFEFIIVVDSFSKDLIELIELKLETHDKAKMVKISKWFNYSSALKSGFYVARGAKILTLPAIQQLSVNDIKKLVMDDSKSDMIIARRKRNLDNIFHRAQSFLFHKIVNKIIGSTFHDLGCHVRIFNKSILNHLTFYGEQHRFLPIIAERFGYKVKEVEVEHFKSDIKHTIYTPNAYLRRISDLFSIFFLVKFTKKPLRFFGIPGILLTAMGVILFGYLGYERLVLSEPLAGRPILLLASLMLVFGIQILAIGLVAEIIIFTHAGKSKDYIIEEIIDNTAKKKGIIHEMKDYL